MTRAQPASFKRRWPVEAMIPRAGREARKFLLGFIPQLDQAGIGSISEVFDAEPPFTPHGCIAQAWSVAEVLRCWAKAA